MDGCRAIHEETYMMILLFSVLNDEQRALVERIFHEHHIHFQRISFNIVKSEEAAEDVVSTAFIKIMDNIEKISDLPCPQMTAFCVTIVKNASIDVLRQLQQSVHIDYWDNISDEDTDDIADECIHNADVHRLTEVIDQLDPDDRHFIYLRHGLLQLLFAACRQNDLAAHLCGSLCSQLAEAAGGAGDNNDLAFHVVFLNVIALVCLQFNYLLSD